METEVGKKRSQRFQRNKEWLEKSKKHKPLSNWERKIKNFKEGIGLEVTPVVAKSSISRSIKSNSNSNVSYTVGTSSIALGLAFHPTDDRILAAGLVSGLLQIFRKSDEKFSCLTATKLNKTSCRGVYFHQDKLYTIGSDGSIRIFDPETLSPIGNWQQAHHTPINLLHFMSNNLMASGDDDGYVKLWDVRENQNNIFTFHEHATYISSFASQDPKLLLATSGDGVLSVYDVKKFKTFLLSENQEEELICCRIVKRGKKVAVTTSSGNIRFFNWKQFGAISDQFPVGQTGDYSCDILVPFHNTRSFSACSDGRIRIFNFFPHKTVGDLGVHSSGYPIECMTLSPDKSTLATSSHDQVIKFWDVAQYTSLNKEESEEDEDEDSEGAPEEVKTATKEAPATSVTTSTTTNKKSSIFGSSAKGFFSGF